MTTPPFTTEPPRTPVQDSPPEATGARPGRAARSVTVMVALTSLASAINYSSNLVFSRLLTPESYGDLTALLALSVVAAVPTGAAQTVVADRIAAHLTAGEVDKARYLMRHAAAHVAVVSTVLGLVYCLSLPLLVSALNLQAVGPAFALIPLVVLSFFMPTAFGILQGFERFVALGGVLLLIAGSRIVFGVPWTLVGGGAGGPLAGQAIGNALALAFVIWLVRSQLLPRGTGAATTGLRRRIDRRALAASGAFIAFALLSNLDIVLAKLLLPAADSGLYAALVTVEKIVIFLPGAVAVVMVPNAAKARVAEGSAGRVLRVSAALIVLTTLVAAIPAAIEPELVLRTMFGEEYLGAADGMLPIVCAGAGLALLYLLVVYTVAIQDQRWVLLLAGAVLAQVVTILLVHGSPTQIATAQAAVIIGVLLVNEIVFHPLVRSRRLLSRRSAA